MKTLLEYINKTKKSVYYEITRGMSYGDFIDMLNAVGYTYNDDAENEWNKKSNLYKIIRSLIKTNKSYFSYVSKIPAEAVPTHKIFLYSGNYDYVYKIFFDSNDEIKYISIDTTYNEPVNTLDMSEQKDINKFAELIGL